MTTYFRKNILNLKAYSSARDEFEGSADVFLDANENPFANEFNRYPDPHQSALKIKIAEVKDIATENILLGNGSDECIDLIIRSFCEPGKDEILVLPPTYGMYAVAANINDVKIIEVPLNEDFFPDWKKIADSISVNTKVVFLCSPNNPSGNTFSLEEMELFLSNFKGIVVIDEAYIDFCLQNSAVNLISKYPNLIVLQTLSKAWGLAGLRIGIMIANAEFIRVFNKIKPPYNISGIAQSSALEILADFDSYANKVKTILDQRKVLTEKLTEFSFVIKVFPSDANFLLVKFKEADRVFTFLLNKKIIVRNRSTQLNCENCLRISIGTPEENSRLIEALKSFN